MPPYEKDELNKIERLKNKLFSNNYETKYEYRNSFPHYQEKDIADSWKEKKDEPNLREKFFMKTSMFKKFFIFSIIFFVLALGYAAYMFFADTNSVSNDNIDISVLSNAFTAGGEDYPLMLEIVNKNNASLDLVDLVIEYPKNSEIGMAQENEHMRISLGTVPAGAVKTENTKLVLFGEQGSVRRIKISLEYRVEGSNAIFVKEKEFDVTISSTPINISVDGPAETSANQDINLNVKTTLNATKSLSGMILKVDYPIGFQFVNATPAPSSGNNVWNLGDFAPGAERDFSISGKMIDVYDGEEKIFRVWTGSEAPGDKSVIGVVFNSFEKKVAVRKSAIEANLVVNGISEGNIAVDTKNTVQGEINWKNNTETKINNLKITAKILGNVVNRKTIVAREGFYNSSQDLIIWDKNSQNKFTEVSPGDSGAVGFSFSPLALFSAQSGITSSPSATIEVTVTGEQAGDAGVTSNLSSDQIKTVKFISDTSLSNKALFYSSSLKNSGSIPLKAEHKTTFTIDWFISNTANNISKTQVKTTLPDWVNFVGKFTPSSEDLTYNPTIREVVWNAGAVPKGAGITGANKEISFQVEIMPSLSQVGTTPNLINETVLTGHDDFANVDIKINKTPLNTRLLNDSGFSPDQGVVTQ